MSKRRRKVQSGRRTSAKRPIDKRIVVANQNNVGTTTIASTIYTATWPGTVVGIRWSGMCANLLTSRTEGYWAIVVIPDGESVKSFSVSDAADFYQPEQNVLAFGAVALAANNGTAGPSLHQLQGQTKAMRKLSAGDKLAVAFVSSAANGLAFNMAVQFFIKT
jgi:hypothetical protein